MQILSGDNLVVFQNDADNKRVTLYLRCRGRYNEVHCFELKTVPHPHDWKECTEDVFEAGLYYGDFVQANIEEITRALAWLKK